MRDALTIVLALVAFVAILLIFFWPLRAIVVSTKVRGLKKLGWIALWFGAFLLGGVADNLRNRPDLQPRAQPLGFALGKFVRTLFVRTK